MLTYQWAYRCHTFPPHCLWQVWSPIKILKRKQHVHLTMAAVANSCYLRYTKPLKHNDKCRDILTFWLAPKPRLTERDTSLVFYNFFNPKLRANVTEIYKHDESPMFHLGLRQKILELSGLVNTNFKQKTSETPREFEKPATVFCQLILPPAHSCRKIWYDEWCDLPLCEN